MATFLHRLCLFALLAATGLGLANCQAREEERSERMEAVLETDEED